MTTSADLAREAVLLQLDNAHEHFVAVARRAHKRGKAAEAAGAHKVAGWLYNAYIHERDDPPPVKRP
jgi:hypothetical protein